MSLTSKPRRPLATLQNCLAAAALAAMLLPAAAASARDLGQWGGEDAALRDWFRSLTMPGHPTVSCCGVADGYWSDLFEAAGDQYVAIITDTRPDGPLGREHIEPGTRLLIPNDKVTWTATNPTGHGWVFVIGGIVYCYLPPTGM